MKRVLKIVLVFVLLLAGGITWFVAQLFWFSPDIVVSKETTWLTAPLADDGLPDYAAYLLEQGREGVTPENNGAVPFLRAVWPAELEPQWQRPLCEHLGMEVPEELGLRDPGQDGWLEEDARKWLEMKEQGEEAVDEELAGTIIEWAQSHPWKRADLPPLAEWIDEHAAQFDLLHEAAASEKYYCPSPSLLVGPKDSLVHVMLPTVQAMRHAANSLKLRAYLSLGEGDVEGAWKDCEAIYRLSAHLPGEMLVGILVKIALDETGDSLALSILDNPHLTPEVARAILAFQRNRAPVAGLAETIDRDERLVLVTSVLAFSGQRKQDNYTVDDVLDMSELGPLKKASVDWNVVLRMVNEWYDKMARVARQEHRTVRQDLLQAYYRDVDILEARELSDYGGALVSRDMRSRLVGESLLYIFIPAIYVVFEAIDRQNTYAELHAIAAALAVHRLEHGAYPESLDALVPGLLEAIPVDPNGNAVVYRRTEEGYLLYSLGENGADENGSNEKLWIHEGYEVEGDESDVRELLGLPSFDPEAPDDEPVGQRIKDKIPLEADDWSIRVPLPRPQPPIP